MTTPQQYVSPDLTHFAGRMLADDEQRYLLLRHILESGELRNPHESKLPGLMTGTAVDAGRAANYSVRDGGKVSDDELYFLSAVCFCDIPVDDLDIHRGKYGRFGLAFPKPFLMARGARPVWYLPRSSRPGPFVSDPARADLAERFDRLFPRITRRYGSLLKALAQGPLQGKEGLINAQNPAPVHAELLSLVEELTFLQTEVFAFVKFYVSSTADEDTTNYYMEREWRCLTNVPFDLSDLKRIIVPLSFVKRFKEDFPSFAGEIRPS